jgi:hypothetical protein
MSQRITPRYLRPMIDRSLGTWLSIGVLLTLAFAQSATAQRRRRPRVIQLEDRVCEAYTPLTLEWVIAAPDACPGATLLRLCGASPPPDGSCPSVIEAADALGDATLDQCAADVALLAVAGAFYTDYSSITSLPRAYRLYRRLAPVAAVREAALWRAARSAYSLSRYEEVLRTLTELLNGRPSPGIVSAAEELYAMTLSYDDWNDDTAPDPEFGVSRFSPAYLPDPPWGFEVALRALALAMDRGTRRVVVDGVAEVRRRWPARADEHALELDRLVARVLEENRQSTELANHLVAAANRCRAHHAGCENEFANLAVAHVVSSLETCRAAPDSDRTLDSCRAGVAFARTWLAGQITPSPTLEADVAATVAWLDTQRPRRRRRGATRTPPPPLTTTTPPHVAAELADRGDLEWGNFRMQVDVEALRACAPPQGAVIDVRVRIASNGSISASTSNTRGAVFDCVRGALSRMPPLSPGPYGGSVLINALIFFAPGARGVSPAPVVRPTRVRP